MKAVDGLTFMRLLVGVWPFGPEGASVGQFGVAQLNGPLRAELRRILAKGF